MKGPYQTYASINNLNTLRNMVIMPHSNLVNLRVDRRGRDIAKEEVKTVCLALMICSKKTR